MWAAFRDAVVASLAPAGAAQAALADRIADLQWRLVRASRFAAAAVAVALVPAATALAAPPDPPVPAAAAEWDRLQGWLAAFRAAAALLARPEGDPADDPLRPAVARAVWEAAAARAAVEARPAPPDGGGLNWFDDRSFLATPSPQIREEYDATQAVRLYCAAAGVGLGEAWKLEDYRGRPAGRVRAGLAHLAGLSAVPADWLTKEAAARLKTRMKEVETRLPAAAAARALADAAAVRAALGHRDQAAAAAAVDLSVRYEGHLGRALESAVRTYLALQAADCLGDPPDPD